MGSFNSIDIFNETRGESQKQKPKLIKYLNGDKYEGEWHNGVRSGYGVYIYHSGDKYEGWWEQNNKNGMGTLFSKDGCWYVGQWENNYKNGQGTFYHRNGDKFYGHFVKGKRNGKGCWITHDNKYIGYFKNNVKHGKGIIYYSKGKIAREIWKEGIWIYSKWWTSEDNDISPWNHNSVLMPQIDFWSGNDLEEHLQYLKNPNSLCNQTKMLTWEVAKYFKARIPNNYFDAMQIIWKTNDLLYDNCKIMDWTENEVMRWLNRWGIDDEKYENWIYDNSINGRKFLKWSFKEWKEYNICDVKDVKIILKSIDFLRIFVKLHLDFIEKLEQQNIEYNNNTNIIMINKINNVSVSASVSSNTNWNALWEGAVQPVRKSTASNTQPPLKKEKSWSCFSGGGNGSLMDWNKKGIVPNTWSMTNWETYTSNIISKNEKDEIIENIENMITKFSITKLLLHSLNISGFNFYIPYNELKFIKKIGEGGFGQVFLGWWNEKEVAIKVFSPKDRINIKNILNKFIKEISIISNLRHPNIVLYIGASIHDDNYYMITEYIPFGNWFEILHNSRHKKILSDKYQIQIAYEISIAMQYLHSRNITHCDMKSSNILLDKDYHVKLGDFGLSRMINILNSEDPKGKFGTTHWMPPEIMRSKRYEEASDVFSYGMIINEMMTGKVPYNGLAQNQIIGWVADCGKIETIPKDGNFFLKKWVKNCLMYQPDKRPTFEDIIKYFEKINGYWRNYNYAVEEINQYLS